MQSEIVGSVQFSPQVKIVVESPKPREQPFQQHKYNNGQPRPIDQYFKSVKHNIL